MRRPLATVLLAGMLSGLAAMATAGDRTVEYTVKAAFLFKFFKFVDWPEPVDALDVMPYRVCVCGDDPFGSLLDPIERQTVKGHQIELVRMDPSGPLESCHLLFISASEMPRLPMLLERLDGRSVLTVGESRGFARAGGMIGFVRQGENVRFEVNPDAARRAGLRISSDLLQLAFIVKERG